MKYFVKYLPVEGEIKEGDMGLKPSIPHLDIDEPYVEIFDEDEVKRLNNPELSGHKFLKGSKKVKLFLCSRDIQVGDKVIVIHKDSSFEEITPTENTLDFVKRYGGFKVIGEISKEATWVKEGDEFDEEDIQIKEIKFKHPFQSLNYTIYQIKGPCGHFH